MKRSALILAIIGIVGGCHAGEQASSSISVSPISKTVSVRSTKDENVTLDKLKASGSSTTQPWTLEVDGLAVNSQASEVNKGVPAIIDADGRRWAVHGQNIIGTVDAIGNAGERIIGAASPIMLGRINADRDKAIAELSGKQAIAEAVAGVASGQWSPRTIEKHLSDEERTEFRRQIADLERRLAEQSATTQPGETP